MSATGDSMAFSMSAGRGRRQTRSPAPSAAAVTLAARVVVVAHEAGDAGAEGDHAGAGERGQIDDGVGCLLGRLGQAVGQDQTTLGVGVDHLDRGAVADREDIAGAGGVGTEHVVGRRHQAGHLHPRGEGGDRGHGGDHRGPAAHVPVHAVHAVRGLYRQPAGVEGDPLAHEHHVAGGSLRGVGHADEAGLVERAPVDAEQPAEPGGLDRRLVHDVHRDAAGLTEGHRPVGQRGRGERSARLVDQVPGHVDGLGHAGAAGQTVGHPGGPTDGPSPLRGRAVRTRT